ncbi:MAG TPA: hypothetical protein VFO25_12095 [Candidatus Eremiobacteraceae bacterium]|nr:hypothetical protein [Candidatus Eremiobacteraceae bacterium]
MAKGVKRRVALVAILLTAGSFGVMSSAPARAMIEAAMSCASTTPCLEWDNTKSGDAVKGVSSNGAGLEGLTKFKSAGKTVGKAGVLGLDTSTSGGLNSGVSGVSVNGAGVTGTSTNLNGVQGFSASGASGVYGQNSVAGGFGVAGRNTATTHDNGGAGVLADGGAHDDGLHAFGTGSTANAIYAFSQQGSSLVANQGGNNLAPELALEDTNPSNSNDIIHADGPNGTVLSMSSSVTWFHTDFEVSAPFASVFEGSDYQTPPLNVYGGGSGTDFEVLTVNDVNGTDVAGITDIGNIGISGLLYSDGSCSGGCIVNHKRVHAVREYTPAESEPTIEDNGEASLVDGVAQVALDPKFANIINAYIPYIVTVTPEGDCRGLFVTQRSAHGFVVRELQGGRSNVSFGYRIVAHRFGVSVARLPMVNVRTNAKPHHPSTHIFGGRS